MKSIYPIGVLLGVCLLSGAALAQTGSVSNYEVPSGVINGVNTTYTLSHSPNPTSSLMLTDNGLLLFAGSDFTLSGSIVTMTTAPLAGDELQAWYTTSGSISLPVATTGSLGAIKVGSGLTVASDGTLSLGYSYTLPAATPYVLGGVKPGSGLIVATDGTLVVPPATGTTLGGVKCGTNITCEEDGTISFNGSGSGSSFTLSPATGTQLGGVMVGPGLSVTSQGVLSSNRDYIDIRDYGALTSNACNDTYIQNAINAAASTGPTNVLIPASPIGSPYFICHYVQVPNAVHLIGEGWSAGGAGSELRASSTWSTSTAFPYNFMVWQFSGSLPAAGGVPNPSYDDQIHDLWINCNSQANCNGLFRMGAQEGTGTWNVVIGNYTGIGLYDQGVSCQQAWTGNPGYTNPTGCQLNVGAPWGSGEEHGDTDIFMYPASYATANHTITYWQEGVWDQRDLSGTLTCNYPVQAGASGGDQYAAYLNGARLKTGFIHVEGCAPVSGSTSEGAIRLGSPAGTWSVREMPMYSATINTDATLVIPAIGNSGIEVQTENPFATSVIDQGDNYSSTCTMFYFQGNGNYFDPCNSSKFSGELDASAMGVYTTAFNDQKCFKIFGGSTTTSQWCFNWGGSQNMTTFQNYYGGMMLQKSGVTNVGAPEGGGLWVYAHGTGTDPAVGGIAAGMWTDETSTFKAEATSATWLDLSDGNFTVHTDHALTAASGYSPTQRLKIDSSGNETESLTTDTINGNATYTGSVAITTTGGTCTITVTLGKITAKSGSC